MLVSAHVLSELGCLTVEKFVESGYDFSIFFVG
jgi:hypothetical protein